MTERLGAARLAGYGVGDLGFNLFWTGLSVYLLIYYTDVLGINPVTAGSIFAISIFWDAVSDPLMGLIVTRTNTRWGKFRPYLLFGAPFMGISFAMMFAAPILFPSAVILSSAIAHIAFRTLYTVVSVPYSSLSSVLTSDSDGRTKLSGARMFGAVLGAIIATVLMPTLAVEFGGEDIKRGWALTSALFAVIATVIMFIVFFSTEEGTVQTPVSKQVSVGDSIRFVRSNYALWIVLGAVMFASISGGVSAKSMLYFLKYNLNAEAQIGPLLGLQGLMVAISIPFWIWFAGKTSKRIAWMTGTIALGLIQISIYMLMPATAGDMMPFFVLIGICFGSFAVMFWSIVPDTVEYGQWRSGIRDEGMAFSLSTFAQKTGGAIGIALLGFYLEAIGYVENVEQTPAALEGLRTATFLFPSLLSIVVAAAIWFYPVDKKKHAEILADIAARDLTYQSTEPAG